MIYGSVCSGIEAATLAWRPLGWRAAFYSEIDAFPSALLAHYYPETPNYGDMTQHKGWPDAAIDVLVGGTPCQSFSVAGLRAGLDDPRGNLALVYLALADRMRPRWLVWENVPGVLSSNGGRDFGAFIGGLVAIGYGVAWRVLDAQYFELAQRRERVFVVGCLGSWSRAAAVLFEPESLRWDPAPRRETGQSIAPTIAGSSNGGGANGPGRDADSAASLIVAHALRGEGFDASEDGTGRGTPIIPVHAFDARQSDVIQYGDIAGPLDTDGSSMAIAFDTTQITNPENRSRPKRHATGRALANSAHPPALATATAVRRLTPRECERLQGFPDDFTLIPYRGSLAKDGPRYKAIGNSMAVPVMAWIGRRIAMVDSIQEAA